MSFFLRPGNLYIRKLKKLIKNDSSLFKIIDRKLSKLENSPTDPSLKSHKVNTPKFGSCFSSRITGDLRIIWRYNQGEIEVIDLLDIGGHNEVY